MKITYKKKDPQEILSLIEERLGGRKLAKILSFKLEGNDLFVTIKKMGTSQLNFSHVENQGEITWTLTKEKIALSHKAFKGEVLNKLAKVVSDTGGQLSS